MVAYPEGNGLAAVTRNRGAETEDGSPYVNTGKIALKLLQNKRVRKAALKALKNDKVRKAVTKQVTRRVFGK